MTRLQDGLLAAAIRAADWAGVDRSLRAGRAVGRVWNALGLPRVRRVREQMALAMPEVDEAQRRAWRREVFEGLGQGVAELLLMSGGRRAELLGRMEVFGLEHLAAAARAAGGRGAVIVGAHLGNWELASARLVELGVRAALVYRPQRVPSLERALVALRRAAPVGEETDDAIQLIPMGPRAGVRFVRALEAGRHLFVLLDQRARRGEGLEVDFFGQPSQTRFGPLKLAARVGAPVLLVFPRRSADGLHHTLSLHPPLQMEPGSTDDEEVLRRNLQRVTAEIEKEIRRTPGQWIWTHRRWR